MLKNLLRACQLLPNKMTWIWVTLFFIYFEKKLVLLLLLLLLKERKKERNQICDEQVDMHNNKVLPDANRIDLINDTIAFAITFLHV